MFQATRWVHGCTQAKLALSLSNLTFQAAQWVHGNGHWVDQSEKSKYWGGPIRREGEGIGAVLRHGREGEVKEKRRTNQRAEGQGEGFGAVLRLSLIHI